MAITSIRRDWGVAPSNVRITSTDTLATVASANYITLQTPTITSLNGGPFGFVAGDTVMVSASDGSNIFDFAGTDFSTLVVFSGGGSVTFPITVPQGGTDLTSLTPYALVSGGTTSTNAMQQLPLGTSGQLLQSNGASSLPTWVNSGAVVTPSPLSEVSDTNITLTLGGSPLISLLHPTSITAGWNGQLAVGRGGTGKPTLVPYAVLTGGTTTTGAMQQVASLGTAGQVLTSSGAGALPVWAAGGSVVTPSALTKSNDTNVTLTLSGTPSTALLQSANIAAGWTGQLSGTRGGTGVDNTGLTIDLVTGAAATKVLTSDSSGNATWQTSLTGVTPQQVQAFAFNSGVDTGIADAYVIALSPPLTVAAATAMYVSFTPIHANVTANPTINIGFGAISIKAPNGQTNLLPGDIVSGTEYSILIAPNGTTAFLLNPTITNATALKVQAFQYNYSADTGTANSYSVSLSPIPISITSGFPVTFTAANSNTSTSTLTLIGSTNPIVTSGNIALVGGEIISGGTYEVIFDSATSAWTLLNSSLSTIPVGHALTEINDTNVTLSLGGTPSTALLQDTSITAGWTGTLSGARGGTGLANTGLTIDLVTGAAANKVMSSDSSGNATWQTGTVVTPSALTEGNDTNITLTLGGSPGTALLQPASITAGWTGTLAVPRGGLGVSSLTPYALITAGTTGTGAIQQVASLGTSGQVLTSSGAGALPTWTTIGSGTVNSGTANQLAYYATTGTTVSGLTGANSSMLVTNATGVPAMTSSLTNGQLIIGSTGATPTPATLTAGTGVTITNAAASITINAASGGLANVTVSGTTQTIAKDTRYFVINASQTVFTLPTSANGDTFKIIGTAGSGGWKINTSGIQQINVNGSATGIGGGSLTAPNATDSAQFVCFSNGLWYLDGSSQVTSAFTIV